MSWLKSLNYKHFLQLISKRYAASEPRYLFRWNQTTKVFTGLLASVCSMMALLSFFGSLEDQKEEPAQSPTPALGASDELSMEFGLDAKLPLQGPALAEPDAQSPGQQESLIQTVSVDQAPLAGTDQASVFHALGQQSGNPHGHIQQVGGDHPIYVFPRRSPGNQPVFQDSEAAAWLTGEIETLE